MENLIMGFVVVAALVYCVTGLVITTWSIHTCPHGKWWGKNCEKCVSFNIFDI